MAGGKLTFSNVVAVLALAVAAGGGAFAVGAIPGSDGRIRACFDRGTGAVRVVDTGVRCRRAERGLRWNVRGRRGAAGAPGAVGPQGPAGEQGPQGLQGVAGSARAFGAVSSGGALSRSSGNVTARRAAQGKYCITVAGYAPPASAALAEIDANGSGGGLAARAYSFETAYCNAGEFAVLIQELFTCGSGTSICETFADGSFFFVIP